MFGGTGFHTWRNTAETERRLLAAERRRLARLRTAHRKLDRRARLLVDLTRVDDALRKHLKSMERVKRSGGVLYARAQTHASHLMRRHNRLVDALNAYVGTSQQVPLIEV